MSAKAEAKTHEEKLAKYRAMADRYREKNKCTWAEACLAIKRMHPEARSVWIAEGERKAAEASG